MVCEEALELLSGHLDGANTEEEEQRLRAHLETCAHCRELLAAFAAVDGAVADLEADPPPQLRQNIMAAVARERAQGPRRRRLAGLAVAAALDHMEFQEIVGSIAGDDTIMCAVRSVEDTVKIMERLRGMIAGDE